MGTRALTRFFDEDGTEIVTMYSQWDGGPEAHGVELATFLDSLTVGNGYSGEGREANGAGDVAALCIWHFKTLSERALARDDDGLHFYRDHAKWPVGGFYLYPPGTSDVDEEYVYLVGTKPLTIDIAGSYVDPPTACTPTEFIERYARTD